MQSETYESYHHQKDMIIKPNDQVEEDCSLNQTPALMDCIYMNRSIFTILFFQF